MAADAPLPVQQLREQARSARVGSSPPRAASQTLTSQINPASDAHTRIQPAHDRATIRECESSSGGGGGVQAQPCLRGLAEEAPPAEGQQALRGVHNRRVRVCEAQSKRWGGATFSSLRPAQFVQTRHGESGVARCTRAPSRCRAFGTRPPALGPFGCVGG